MYVKTRSIQSVIGENQRKVPITFQRFIKKQFEIPELCNIYQKGERTYIFQDGWNQINTPSKDLENCLDNLWYAFCEISTEVLQDKDGYQKVFSKIIATNKELGCPMTTAMFKDLLRKDSKK